MRCQTKVVLFTAAIAARLIDENGPELVAIVALARIAGSAMRARGLPVLPILLSAKVSFLLAFFVLAVVLGPFPDSDAPAALLTAFAGVAGMAVRRHQVSTHSDVSD